MEMPMCFPPKDDKYSFLSIPSSDEVSVPPSKQRHQPQEAMYACVGEDTPALVEPVTIGVTGQDGAYNIYYSSLDCRSPDCCFA